MHTTGVELDPLWFALSVKSRHERSVSRALRVKELQEYAPMYRERHAWSDRVKRVESPLFPGYVFCRFSYAQRLAILNTPGVMAILGAGKVFSPIPEEEIASIRTLVDSGVPVRPCAYLAPGDVVCIERGPLAGVRGAVLRTKNSKYLVVSIELLQRSVVAEVDFTSVTLADVPRLAYKSTVPIPSFA
jgi:transcription antitermination factor NusG